MGPKHITPNLGRYAASVFLCSLILLLQNLILIEVIVDPGTLSVIWLTWHGLPRPSNKLLVVSRNFSPLPFTCGRLRFEHLCFQGRILLLALFCIKQPNLQRNKTWSTQIDEHCPSLSATACYHVIGSRHKCSACFLIQNDDVNLFQLRVVRFAPHPDRSDDHFSPLNVMDIQPRKLRFTLSSGNPKIPQLRAGREIEQHPLVFARPKALTTAELKMPHSPSQIIIEFQSCVTCVASCPDRTNCMN